AFLSSETTYQRARSIAVGTSDQRRVFGMDHQSYRLLDQPYRISHAVDDNLIAAACLNRYTMYRRAGFSVRRVTEDATLAKQNKTLLVFRQRYGGQMNHGSAVAIMEDAMGGSGSSSS